MRAINTVHGSYHVTEYEVEITQEMRDDAFDFAREIKTSNNQYSRLLPNELRQRTANFSDRILQLEIQRTYVGKLGELAFLTYLNENGINVDTRDMFAIYEGQQNTDAFDFATNNGMSIDVKTGFRQNHTRLLVNREQFESIPKDIYVAVKLNARDYPGDGKLIYSDSVHSAVIKGYAEKRYLSGLEYRDFGEGPAKSLPYDRLMGIDRLLRCF